MHALAEALGACWSALAVLALLAIVVGVGAGARRE